MITTGHLLIGGAIGVTLSLKAPPTVAAPLALGLGVLSHHLLDLLPHTDAETFWPEGRARVPLRGIIIVALETLLGLGLTVGFFFAQYTTLAFAAGALGGVLPDVFDCVPLWQARFRRSWVGGWWHRWHLRLHCGSMESAWATGLAIDVVVVSLGVWYLLV